MRQYISIIGLCCSLSLFGQEEPAGHGKRIAEIKNINNWISPVKMVFKKYKLPLKRVVIYERYGYLVFYTAIPWDPMTQPNSSLLRKIEVELFLANKRKSFAIQDEENKIRIEMDKIGKHHMVLNESIVVLEGGELN